jgi:hypothetical protein
LNSVFALENVDRWNPIRTSAIQSRSRPMRFLDFSNREKGAPRQEISKWSTVCSMFWRSGWSVVRSASLAKGGTSKKRPSSHLHRVPSRSNKVIPRILQAALVFYFMPLCFNNFTFISCFSLFARYVFTGVKIQVEVFWVVTPCSVAVGYKRFGGSYCLFRNVGNTTWRHNPEHHDFNSSGFLNSENKPAALSETLGFFTRHFLHSCCL